MESQNELDAVDRLLRRTEDRVDALENVFRRIEGESMRALTICQPYAAVVLK